MNPKYTFKGEPGLIGIISHEHGTERWRLVSDLKSWEVLKPGEALAAFDPESIDRWALAVGWVGSPRPKTQHSGSVQRFAYDSKEECDAAAAQLMQAYQNASMWRRG